MKVGTCGCSLTILNKLDQKFLSLVANTSDVSGGSQKQFLYLTDLTLSLSRKLIWCSRMCITCSFFPGSRDITPRFDIQTCYLYWGFLVQHGDTLVSNCIYRILNHDRVWVFPTHRLVAPNSTTQWEETNCVTRTQEELLTQVPTHNSNLICRNVK